MALPDAGALATSSLGLAAFDQFQLQLSGMEQALGYATMGERFLAFLCDASIEAVLVATFLAYYAESSLNSEALTRIAPWVIPWAYMTLSEFLFHRTIGKCLLRIQLRTDSPEPRYPSLFRILLRETIGKFVSALIGGIGFLAGGWNDKHKTWADRMANTVVVRTGTVSGLLVLVLICANLGISYALTEAAVRHATRIAQQFDTTETRIEDVHVRIFKSLFGSEPHSAKEYQQIVATVPSMLDEYSRLLTEEQGLVLKTYKLSNSRDPIKFEEAIYKQVIVLRQEIAVQVRKHVDMVLAFDPHRQNWNKLLQDRERMLDEINWRNDRINTVGKVFLPQKYKFVHQDLDNH